MAGSSSFSAFSLDSSLSSGVRTPASDFIEGAGGFGMADITIAGIGAGMAAIITAFKGLNFAEGGVVPGTNYQDGITARVSSGEMIMNEHDQKQLYDSIHSGSFGSGVGELKVAGENLVTVINNVGMRRGWGKLKFE